MNCQTNQQLTPEKYQEIKNKLENENLEKFPSVFQQARNLAKQAWTSGIDVAKGKPLLASAEKAAARLEICKGCEFFKEDRCLKCGCFMNAKIHVESAGCPINKWGPDLQRMYSPEEISKMQNRPTSPQGASTVVDISSFSQDEAERIKFFMNRALMFDGRFSYNGLEYLVKENGQNGENILYILSPRRNPPKQIPPPPQQNFPSHNLNSEPAAPDSTKKQEFLDLVEKQKLLNQSTIFEFEGLNYYINMKEDNTFNVYKIDQEILEKLFKPIRV